MVVKLADAAVNVADLAAQADDPAAVAGDLAEVKVQADGLVDAVDQVDLEAVVLVEAVRIHSVLTQNRSTIRSKETRGRVDRSTPARAKRLGRGTAVFLCCNVT